VTSQIPASAPTPPAKPVSSDCNPRRCAIANAASNYRIGALYSLFTAGLLATQHPFSVLGAKHLSTAKFILIGEIVLLLSVPFMILSADARRDFRAIICSGRRLVQFGVLLLIGLFGVLLYSIGLSKAHPIVIAAVMNLAPFWAALLALMISRKAIPTSWPVFLGCLVVAFIGAMMTAISQSADGASSLESVSLASLSGAWIFAVPVPILYALSGSLVGKWFADFDDSATLAATFLTGAVVLIPATVIYAYAHSDLQLNSDAIPAIILLMVGTAASSALGRILYQVSLTVTGEDNGFVSMFFLLIPAVTALLSLSLSPWIQDLRFTVGPLFYAGLAVVAASMFLFSWAAWRSERRQNAESEQR
jgi:drug/metabolite transporter (DMT)-like permease